MANKVVDPRNQTTAQLSDMLLRAAYRMPTGEMATKRAARLCSALAISEGERLPLCYGFDHCGCLSCTRCRTREQRLFMFKAHPLLDPGKGTTSPIAINVIPGFGRTEVGALPKGGLRSFKNQISAHFRKAGTNAVAVMSVDVSVERRVGEQEYWQWHVHGILFNPDETMLERLRQQFSWREKDDSNGVCYRPVQTKPISDRFGWLAYMSKPDFYMREQRPDHNGQLKISKMRISMQQEIALVKVLSKFKVKQRFFYIGMDPL